jgi:hypothetical protein
MAINQLEATKYLYTGIFADEKVLQFLELLQSLGDQCLQELHQVAIDKAYGGKPAHLLLPSELNPSSAYGMAFHTGLQTIRNWGTEVLQQEVERMRKQCPYIDDLYRYTVARYLQEIYRHERPQTISIDVPPLRDFLHQFYIQLGSNPLTKNLKYFTTFGVEKKSLMMDAIRLALFRLLEKQIDFQTTTVPLGGHAFPPPSARPTRSAEKPLRPWNDAVMPEIPPTPVPPTPGMPKTPRRESPPPIKAASASKHKKEGPTLEEMMEEMKLAAKRPESSSKRQEKRQESSSKRSKNIPDPDDTAPELELKRPESSSKRPESSSKRPQSSTRAKRNDTSPDMSPRLVELSQKTQELETKRAESSTKHSIPSPPHLKTPIPSVSKKIEPTDVTEDKKEVTEDSQTRTIHIDVETVPIPSNKSTRSSRKKTPRTELFDADFDHDLFKK